MSVKTEDLARNVRRKAKLKNGSGDEIHGSVIHLPGSDPPRYGLVYISHNEDHASTNYHLAYIDLTPGNIHSMLDGNGYQVSIRLKSKHEKKYLPKNVEGRKTICSLLESHGFKPGTNGER
ncbi:MAG TPA: hypothetical protein VJH92_05375 [Candidatus Nanoarchaeia archaeon]|nr:hypothetical protein [Candidatus Nanoarchaeia archaeon]